MQPEGEVFKSSNPFTGHLALLYKGLESVMDYAIYVIDPGGYIRSWSSSAERVKGFTESEILNQHYSKFYLPEDIAKGVIEYEMKMAREKGRFENESWRKRSNGEKFWADEIIYPIYENSKLLGYLKITRDLSLKKQALEKLEAEKNNLEKTLYAQITELKNTNERLQKEIKEKEQAQANLYISEQRYRILTDLTQNIVCVRNPEGKFIAPQPSWEQFTGQTFEQYKNFGWLDAIHPNDRDAFYSVWQQSVRTKTPFQYSLRLHCRTDEYRYVISQAAPIFNWENNISEWVGAYLDIHELKQVENALRETTMNMNMAIQASGMGIWNWFIQEDRLIWDSQMHQLFGITVEQFRGTFKSIVDNIHPDDRESVMQLIKQVLQDRQDYRADFRIIWPDKSIHYLSTRGKVFDAPNQSLRLTGVCWDITTQKRLEAERSLAIQQAEAYLKERVKASEKYKSELEKIMQTLCHEIRNPLNGLQGAINWLRDISDNVNEIIKLLNPTPILPGAQSASTKPTKNVNLIEIHENLSLLFKSILEIIEITDESIEHLNDVVSNILLHAKIEAGKINIVSIPFDPEQTISALIKTQSNNKILLEKGLKFNVNLPEKKFLVKGDAAKLKIIFLNLLTNAIKFTKKGVISISLLLEIISPQKTNIRIIVSDTGIGMTEEEQRKVFNRFSQIQETGSNIGTGLGLSIAKGFVDAMDGNITVSSRKGYGTTFTVTIPMQNLTEEETLTFQQQAKKRYECEEILFKTELLKNRALIVEDNPVNQKVLARYLQTFGYEYNTANNGKEALEILNQQQFDIVLMDIFMPVMDGFLATKAIRDLEEISTRKRIPIIGVSGNVSDQSKALESGMDDFIVKPIKKDALKIKMTYWLAQTSQSHHTPFPSSILKSLSALSILKPPAKLDTDNLLEKKEAQEKQKTAGKDESEKQTPMISQNLNSEVRHN